MEEVYQHLLYLTGRALFSAHTEPLPKNIDWQALYDESRSQALTLLIFDCLNGEERAAMPPALLEQWKRQALSTLWWNEQILTEQGEVLHQIRSLGVSCVILKGTSSAISYPNPQLRAAGDIDLLAAPEDRTAIRGLLEKMGYRPPADHHHCHDSMSKGKLVVELHWEPNGVPDSAVGNKIRAYLRPFVRHPQIVDGIPMLPPCPRAVVLLLHKLEHIINTGLGLRQLCDWAVFVHRELTPECWKELSGLLHTFGLMAFTKMITRICVEYLSLPAQDAPWCMGADAALCEELLQDMLRTGNFGKKEERYGQRLFTDPQARGRISSFFRIGVSACQVHWPPCKRCPLLLAVAPVALLLRYRKQRKLGQRPPLHLIQMYQGADQRQKLNAALRPFLPTK